MSGDEKANEKKVGAVQEAFRIIREDNARLEAKIDRLLAHLGASGNGHVSNGGSGSSDNGGAGGAVATLADIQGERGDFEVKAKKNPRGWDGESCDGLMVSECPPKFLEAYANLLDWKADNPQAGKEKYAKYERLNAARCRRWAIEIREGRVTPKAPRRDEGMAPPPGAGYGSENYGGPPADDDGGMPPPPGGEDDCPF